MGYLNASKKKALKLLVEPDGNGSLPLIISAQLKSDLIYKRLLLADPAPGYTKKQLQTALGFRQNQVGGLKKKTVFAAFLESFCPSASIAELTESFAYSGLVA